MAFFCFKSCVCVCLCVHYKKIIASIRVKSLNDQICKHQKWTLLFAYPTSTDSLFLHSVKLSFFRYPPLPCNPEKGDPSPDTQ